MKEVLSLYEHVHMYVYRIAAKYSNAARKKAVFESILGQVREKIVAFEICTS